jgi:hypothetical protein
MLSFMVVILFYGVLEKKLVSLALVYSQNTRHLLQKNRFGA